MQKNSEVKCKNRNSKCSSLRKEEDSWIILKESHGINRWTGHDHRWYNFREKLILVWAKANKNKIRSKNKKRLERLQKWGKYLKNIII